MFTGKPVFVVLKRKNDGLHPVTNALPEKVKVSDSLILIIYRASYYSSETETKKKIIRGGAFDMDVFRLRSAYRSSEFSELPLRKIGFRIVLE